jgi:hypothetical protein
LIGADFLVANNVQLTFNYRKMGKRDFLVQLDAFEDEELSKDL